MRFVAGLSSARGEHFLEDTSGLVDGFGFVFKKGDAQVMSLFPGLIGELAQEHGFLAKSTQGKP